MNTFSIGTGHSPHYAFHSACSQMSQLEWIWEMIGATNAVKAKMADDLLRLWQFEGSTWISKGYQRWWNEFALSDPRPGELESVLSKWLASEITTETELEGVTRYVAFFPDGRIFHLMDAYTNEAGDRVRHGECISWHSITEGERSVFSHGDLTEPWSKVSRQPSAGAKQGR